MQGSAIGKKYDRLILAIFFGGISWIIRGDREKAVMAYRILGGAAVLTAISIALPWIGQYTFWSLAFAWCGLWAWAVYDAATSP